MSDEENKDRVDIIWENLNNLLRLFKNRPHHLAKFLIENGALTKEFTEKLRDSDKLNNLTNSELEYWDMYFKDIPTMNNFFNSFLDDIETMKKTKSMEQISMDMNRKLTESIKSERFEDAARIRDYMLRNNIKRNY